MELYGTFLRYLSLKELRSAGNGLSIKELTQRFERYPGFDNNLSTRLRDSLINSFNKGLVTRDVKQITPTKGAYVYTITQLATDQIDQYDELN